MKEFFSDPTAVAIFSAIVFGTLGTALWDILKPGLIKLGDLLFVVLSLGMKRASDSVYREAARSNSELASVHLVKNISPFLSGFLISVFVIFSMNLYTEIEFVHRYDKCLQFESIIEVNECKRLVRQNDLQWVFPFVFGIGMFFAINIMYGSLWISRVNSLVTQFNQCLNICRPLMSQEDSLRMIQEFALMSCKEDYVKLYRKLHALAEDNGIEFPGVRYTYPDK